MVKTMIICPTCKKNGNIEISTEPINNSLSGVISVNIAKDIICEHSFIAYIDKNLNIRGYFATDFQIEIPELPLSEKDFKTKIPKEEIIDLDLIKLNIPPILLVYILKSIFSKKKIVLIFEQEFLYNQIYNFFNYITKNSFNTNISIITEKKYKSNKKNYKDAMVFKNAEIIRNVNKTIDLKKLKVEKQIIHNFITESDLDYSYIRLKSDIQKSYEFSKKIMKLLEDYKNSEGKREIGKKELSDMLAEKIEIKLSIYYIEFLLEILENYFKYDLSIVSELAFPAFGI